MTPEVSPPPAPPSALSRRTLLKRGLFGGAVLTLGGAGFLATRHGPAVVPPAEGLLVLSPREYAVVEALAPRFIPVSGPAPGAAAEPSPGPTVWSLHVARQVDRILSRTPKSAQQEVKQLLGLFDNALAGLLLHGHVRPFTALSADAQDEVLRRWESSRLSILRTGFLALRTVVMSAFYSQPDSWPTVGYPGPPTSFRQPQAPVWRGVGPRL